MIRYLHLDCEMGGRELKYSLLTAYFLVTDEQFVKLDELYLRVKPDDGDYVVSGQGLRVNGIDLAKHDEMAIPYKQAKPILYNFLKKNCVVPLSEISMNVKLTPVGHGVRGDIKHIIDKLSSEGSWEQFCTYHYIDTSVVLQFLRACHKMPAECDGSVGALAKYFHIKIDGDLHEADVDAKTTCEILRSMVELGKDRGAC